MSPVRFFQRYEFLLSLVKEALFPRHCGVCERTGKTLCPECLSLLSNSHRQSQVCGSCGIRETPLGALCFDCRGNASHDGIFSAFRYDDARIAHVIHLFKYRFVEDVGQYLGDLLGEVVLRSELPLPDAIFPVPLHKRRERWRGWNQSDILADALTRNFPENIRPPVIRNTLIRVRSTAPQMSIRDKKLRAKNIEGAFRVVQAPPDNPLFFDINEKRLWLVDDVAASGSTINACARALKERGAREVFGIVVAR